MAQSYTRQSTFADGDTITAALFNNEYDQLVNAFSYSSTNSTVTRHTHDVSAGQGGNIGKIGDIDFLNKIEVDNVNNRWGVYVEVTGVSTEQVRVQDGSIVPVTTNDIDLGSGSLQFKDLFIDGTASIDSLTLSSGVTVDVILDEDNLVSNSATALATQQSIKAYVDAQVTAQDLDVSADTGTISIDLDSETITFVGGTGIDTAAVVNDVFIAIDSTVATLTDVQTLTNKTIDASLNTLSNIANGSLTNSTVSYGGVQLSLGGSDATPAFNLVDATGYLGDSALVTTGALNSGSITSGFGSIDVGSSSITTLGTVSGGTLTGTLSTAAQANVTSVGTLTSLAVSGDLTVDTSTLKVDSANNRVGILNAAPDVTLDIGSATDAVHVPVGTTAQRPGTPAAGYFRYNADLEQFEGYTDTWGAIGGGGTNTFTFDSFTGDNTTVDFVLSQATNLEGNLIVFIDGVFQTQDAYTIATASGITTLTFSAAPATGRYIAVYTVAAGVSGNNMNLDSFSGDGATTDFTLSINAINENNTQIFIDGVYQQKDGYTVTNTTLSFSAAPPLNSTIEVMTFTQTEVNVPVDNSIEPIHIKAGDFYFDTDTLYIDSVNNRVGIGTSSPSFDLDISTSSSDQLRTTSSTTISNFYQTSSGGTTVLQNTSGQMAMYTGGSEAMRIDASGNVGIGTSNPVSPLTTSIGAGAGGSLNNQISMTHSGASNSYHIKTIRATANDEPAGLAFVENTTERMRIDSDGNVGIGTSSPSSFDQRVNAPHLVVGSGNNSAGLTLYTGSSSQGSINFATGLTTTQQYDGGIVYIPGTGMTFHTNGGTERMRIDSSGNVGIGVVPSTWAAAWTALDIGDGTLFSQNNRTTGLGSNIYFTGSDWLPKETGESALYQISQGTHNWYIDSSVTSGVSFTPTPKMTLDASGNLLVGTTTVNGEGITLGGTNNYGYFSRSGDAALFVNRNTNDGALIELRRADVAVGSIGTKSSLLTIGTGTTGLIFDSAQIYPWNITTNSGIDASKDLGAPAARFKDLYLSGGVYVGGTGAANLLDDYEEGTWTGTLTGSTTAPSATQQATGSYTKIGNLVTVNINFDNKDVTGVSGNIVVSGLPFTSSATTQGSGWCGRVASATDSIRSYINSINEIIFVNSFGSAVAWASSGTGTYVGITISFNV